MKILVTGAAGFLGSNFVKWLLSDKCQEIDPQLVVGLDLLRPNGNYLNLQNLVDEQRFDFVRGDIRDSRLVGSLISHHRPDVLVNFANAECSESDPLAHVKNNIEGVQVLIDAASSVCKKFIQVSSILEDERVPVCKSNLENPPNRYLASKLAADSLVRAAVLESDLPALIFVPGSAHGPAQFPDYPIPSIITALLRGQRFESGSKTKQLMFHCDQVSSALSCLLLGGENGGSYTLSNKLAKTVSEFELISEIARLLGLESKHKAIEEKPLENRTWLNELKFKCVGELGWKPSEDPGRLLAETVQWYVENSEWLESLQCGDYLNSYRDRPNKKESQAG